MIHSTFPHPPTDFFYYNVPDTDLVIKFKNNLPVRRGREADIAKVYRDATADVFHHSKTHTTVAAFDHFWLSNNVQLEVRPGKREPEQVEVLTWRYFLIAITGFRAFTKEYPGRFFDFELYWRRVDAEGVMKKFHLGDGLLGPLGGLRVGDSAVVKGSIG
ncbi:MAG: hypothetical protein Q9186_003000 [Xanthomendoza sp. 1 TL-2023]